MNRKQFLNFAGVGAAAAAIGGIVGCAGETADGSAQPSSATFDASGEAARRAVYVPSGGNRFEEAMLIWGVIPLQVKISTKDSTGSLFAFEHANMGKGGPPRHFHYEQDE